MRVDYVIVGTNMRVMQRRAAQTVNRWGGAIPAAIWSVVGLSIGMVLLVLSLYDGKGVGSYLMWGGLALHFVDFWFLGRHLIFYLSPWESLSLTSDKEIIALDKEWTRYIGTLPANARTGENARRFMVVVGLDKRPGGEARSATINTYLETLGRNNSPYPTM